jgi:glutamate--cysteine ligase
MKKRIAALLDTLAQDPKARKLLRFQRGIEKEALRIDPNGLLAQTAHPKTLGSPLTHASITTDYSEALLEFITPVSDSTEQTLQQLHDIHRYVYDQLGHELLWTASMPCALTADSDIPVAQYGSSNSARLKTVYRYGLGHRYGRRMQTIAGIHYNFSLPESFWPWLQSYTQNTQDVNDFRTERYLGLIRNFQRWSWLLVYLFGASPAQSTTAIICLTRLR